MANRTTAPTASASSTPKRYTRKARIRYSASPMQASAAMAVMAAIPNSACTLRTSRTSAIQAVTMRAANSARTARKNGFVRLNSTCSSPSSRAPCVGSRSPDRIHSRTMRSARIRSSSSREYRLTLHVRSAAPTRPARESRSFRRRRSTRTTRWSIEAHGGPGY
jgi:hypothetical protein